MSIPVEWLEDVPVFPLPNVVFFPGTVLHLHVFEPRYRAMMRDVLTSGRRVLAVTLLRPGFEAQYQAAPAMHELCTVGRFDQCEELPDGRFNFSLQGVARVRLHEHPQGERAYRRARAELLECGVDSPKHNASAVTALMSTAALVATHVRRMQPDFSLGVTPDLAPGQVADVLTDRLIADPAVRQLVLEALDVRERLRLVTDRVADLLGELDVGPRGRDSRPLQ
jgi:uncharacterized protein